MNLKKIWIAALIFGLIATGIFYVYILSKSNQEEITPVEPIEEVETTEETNPKNTLIPISKGNRAMSLQVSVVQGVSGFIEPGSSVDVIAILDPSEDEFAYTAGQHDAATLLLQNIKVLAIGHSADTTEEAQRYETVTLEVTPKEGLYLGFAARNNNQIYLTLRSEGDTSVEPDATHIHEDNLHEGVFKP